MENKDLATNPKVLDLIKKFPGYGTVRFWPEKNLYQFVARLCYTPHIFKPDTSEYGLVFSKAANDRVPGYTCAFGIPPEIDVAPLQSAIAAALREKGLIKQGQRVPNKFSVLRTAGSIEEEGRKALPVCSTSAWYQGKTKSSNKPVVWANVGGQRKELAEGQVRGGYWALLSVTVGAFDAKNASGQTVNQGTQLYLNDLCLLFPDEIIESGGGVADPGASYGALDDLPPSDIDILDAEEVDADTGDDGTTSYMDGIPF